MTDIVIHNNRRYRRVVRDQQTYRLGVTLGLVTLHGREWVCRLEKPMQWEAGTRSEPAAISDPSIPTVAVKDFLSTATRDEIADFNRRVSDTLNGLNRWIVIAPAGGSQA